MCWFIFQTQLFDVVALTLCYHFDTVKTNTLFKSFEAYILLL